MKARKSSPKSIRFNINDFEAGMLKGNFESAQDMVDCLLKNYVQGENIKTNTQKNIQQKINTENIVTELPLTQQEILNKISDIRNEKIPKERDTVHGRKSWKIDQDNRIKKLMDSLVLPS